jgi:hypothetical protein
MHGVVIRRQALDEQQRAYTTVEAARRHARNIVKNATARAEAIEQQAIKEGFQAGWIDSLNAMMGALQDSEAFCRKVEADLKNAVHDKLMSAMNQPELALHLIKGWLEANAPEPGKLRVIVPASATSQVDAIKKHLLEDTGMVPVVSVGTGKSVVLQFQDQGVEFSPERTCGELNELVDSCFHQLAVKRQCLSWRDEITRQWLSTVAQQLGPEPHVDEVGVSNEVGAANLQADTALSLRANDVGTGYGCAEEGVIVKAHQIDAMRFEEQMDQELFGDFEDELTYEQDQ